MPDPDPGYPEVLEFSPATPGVPEKPAHPVKSRLLVAGAAAAVIVIAAVVVFIGALPPYAVARLGVGLVPQERGIFPSLTVRENLTVFARPPGNGGWTLQRIFDLFPGLRARERNLGFQLSGGEQQMLSIARALMLNPSLLLLDEPSEGLAPLIVQEIVEVLKRLKGEGLAILLVEQNLRAAFAVADRHHVMNKGAICFTGTTAELEGNEFVLRNYLSV